MTTFRLRPIRIAFFRAAAAVLACWLGASAKAARPSYEAASEFGRVLAAAYAAERGDALVARLDGDALFRATFEPLGKGALASASLQDIWKNTLLPAVQRDLKTLEAMPVFLMSRVQMLNGKRALECTFTNDRGQFQVLVLRLEAGPNGEIFITDFHQLGRQLEMSRRMRHLFLLLGASREPGLDAEERALSWAAEGYQREAGESLRQLGAGRAEEAYAVWERFPDKVRAGRVWQEFRDTMAFMGSKRAAAAVQQAYQRGQLANGLLRLEQARAGGDLGTILKAWDALLADSHGPPFLLAAKAGELLEGGRPQEALALARGTYADYPLGGSAYVVATHAACKMGSMPEALNILRDWALVVPRKTIDEILRGDVAFAELVKTDLYRVWRDEPGSATTVREPLKA
jgi:hypothetical protein